MSQRTKPFEDGHSHNQGAIMAVIMGGVNFCPHMKLFNL